MQDISLTLAVILPCSAWCRTSDAHAHQPSAVSPDFPDLPAARGESSSATTAVTDRRPLTAGLPRQDTVCGADEVGNHINFRHEPHILALMPLISAPRGYVIAGSVRQSLSDWLGVGQRNQRPFRHPSIVAGRSRMAARYPTRAEAASRLLEGSPEPTAQDCAMLTLTVQLTGPLVLAAVF